MMALFVLSPEVGEVRSEHFITRHDSTSAGTARLATKAAERAYDSVKRVLSIEAPTPVIIVIVSSKSEFRKDGRLLPEGLPAWAVGAARPASRTILLSQPYGAGLKYEDIAEVITHEYTHIAVGNYLEGIDFPRWFDEGLADFMGGRRSLSASLTIGAAALTGRLIPLKALDRKWPRSSSEAQLAYAEASDFVGYMEKEFGAGTVKRILHETRLRKDLNTAVENITGETMAEIEGDWLKHVMRVYRWLPILTGGVTIWAFGAVMVIIGYIRKKKIGKLKYRLWELEEKLAGLSYEEREKFLEENEGEKPPERYKYH